MALGQDQSGYTLQAVRVPTFASQNITVGAASAQCTNAFGANTAIVRVATDCNCRISFGTNPTATNTSPMLPAGSVEYYAVPKGGAFKLAVIQHGSATGTINVAEY